MTIDDNFLIYILNQHIKQWSSMIYLLCFLIGLLIGRVRLPIKSYINKLTCSHTHFSSRELGFQTFHTCKCCGKVWE